MSLTPDDSRMLAGLDGKVNQLIGMVTEVKGDVKELFSSRNDMRHDFDVLKTEHDARKDTCNQQVTIPAQRGPSLGALILGSSTINMTLLILALVLLRAWGLLK